VRFFRDPFRILTDRTWIRRASVDEMVDMMFKICKEENLDLLGIEANDIDEYLAPLIAAKAVKLGWHPHIRWKDHNTNKEIRLTSFTSFIENGLVLFQKENSDQKELIEQWKFLFQSGMKDDGPDAHEAACGLAQNFTAGVKFHRTPKSGGIASLFKKGAW
jgi:predicted phage terminase large subunit-like protein